MEWYSISELDLDFTHQVVSVFSATHSESWRDATLTLDDVLVNCPLSMLFTMYHMWRAGDLRRLAFHHRLHVSNRSSAQDMIEKLDEHACSRDCPSVIIVFQTLRRLRGVARVDAARARMRGE